MNGIWGVVVGRLKGGGFYSRMPNADPLWLFQTLSSRPSCLSIRGKLQGPLHPRNLTIHMQKAPHPHLTHSPVWVFAAQWGQRAWWWCGHELVQWQWGAGGSSHQETHRTTQKSGSSCQPREKLTGSTPLPKWGSLVTRKWERTSPTQLTEVWPTSQGSGWRFWKVLLT